MKSLYLNENGDIEFDNLNKLKMIDGTDEIAQRNKIMLSIRQGEWVFNKTLGIPWFNIMEDKDITNNAIKKILKGKIEEDENIEEVIEMEIERDRAKRKAIISFKAKMINGDVFETEEEVEV